MNDLVMEILRQLNITEEQTKNLAPEKIRNRRIEAAKEFQNVFNRIDPKRSVAKKNVYLYIQRVAAEEIQGELRLTRSLVIYAIRMMKLAKNDDDYRKIIQYFESKAPLQ